MNFDKNIASLFQKYPELNTGKVSDSYEFKKLNWLFRLKIPKWFVQLMTHNPLADMKIGIPFNYGWENLKGKTTNELPLLNTYFNSFEDIYLSAADEFPACVLFRKKYICIAFDENNSGDGFYINLKEKNPEVIYIYHDCGINADELIHHSQKIADSLTEFFEIIKPPEDRTI